MRFFEMAPVGKGKIYPKVKNPYEWWAIHPADYRKPPQIDIVGSMFGKASTAGGDNGSNTNGGIVWKVPLPKLHLRRFDDPISDAIDIIGGILNVLLLAGILMLVEKRRLHAEAGEFSQLE